MEIVIQKEIKEMLPCKRHISDDLLEIYIDLAALYSKRYWLILIEERLRRIENEITVI